MKKLDRNRALSAMITKLLVQGFSIQVSEYGGFEKWISLDPPSQNLSEIFHTAAVCGHGCLFLWKADVDTNLWIAFNLAAKDIFYTYSMPMHEVVNEILTRWSRK